MNRKQIMSDVMAMQMKNTENAWNNDEKIGIEITFDLVNFRQETYQSLVLK